MTRVPKPGRTRPEPAEAALADLKRTLRALDETIAKAIRARDIVVAGIAGIEKRRLH